MNNSPMLKEVQLVDDVISLPGMIYKKMSEVMKDIGAIGKDQKNQAQGFKFRGIDQFVNSLYPALVKHGVFMAPRSIQHTQELRDVVRGNGKQGVDKHVSILMEYKFYAEDGSSVTIGPIPAEGLDSGDKATNKALSAALKYALIQTFSIPTEDMAEADLESPEIGSSTEKKSDVSKKETVASMEVQQQTVEQTSSLQEETVASKKGSSFRKPVAKAAKEEPQEQGWE
jgi:hypothetical protein